MDYRELKRGLVEIAVKNHVTIHELNPKDIYVREWVRWKCQFGCKGFARHLSCPPYVPGPEVTRRLLSEYHKAYLIHFAGIPGMKDIDPDKIPKNWHPFLKKLILWIAETVYELEQHAFYQGYYKAFGSAAYPCIFCDDCVAEQMQGTVALSVKRMCPHGEKVRTSMEAAGIDVFATVRKAGLPISVVPCKNNEYGMIVTTDINSYGLLLIE
jgi:predicted metal-binding protein